MNITLILHRSMDAAFHKICGSLKAPIANKSTAIHTEPPRAVTCHPEVKRRISNYGRPLRVLRFVEGGLPRSSVGRMVMSGSMADVCAELDRLVAQEMAIH